MQGIKELIKKKPSKSSQPKMLNINNKKKTTNNYAIATEFNTFFNTIVGKIDEKLIPKYQYQTTLNEPNQNTMTKDEIKSIIKELKTNKTTRPNSILTKIPFQTSLN